MTLHMKSKNLILTAILMAVSSTVMAQENIQKAFDALRQSKGQEETYTNHFLERDPDTGLMEGMSDEYEFKIADKANKHLITAIRQAFDKDEQAAYSVSTGSHGGAENYISLGEEGWFNHRAHHQDLCYYAEVQTEKDEYQSYDQWPENRFFRCIWNTEQFFGWQRIGGMD